MEILTGNFYFVSDNFFEKINDLNLKMNYKTTQRPHYFALQDKKTSLFWLVPCSSKIEKFEKIVLKRKEYNRPNDTIKIVTIQNKKTALLLQDMFPITRQYITNQYIRGGQAVRIADIKVIADIERSARRVIILLRQGVKFTPNQPDILRIENMMLNELNKKCKK